MAHESPRRKVLAVKENVASEVVSNLAVFIDPSLRGLKLEVSEFRLVLIICLSIRGDCPASNQCQNVCV